MRHFRVMYRPEQDTVGTYWEYGWVLSAPTYKQALHALPSLPKTRVTIRHGVETRDHPLVGYRYRLDTVYKGDFDYPTPNARTTHA